MTDPTYSPSPRATFVQLRRTLPPSSCIVSHLSIDGAAVGYFEDHDAALWHVSETAKMPGWWPAASSPSQARIVTDESRALMQRIQSWADRGPKPFATGAR